MVGQLYPAGALQISEIVNVAGVAKSAAHKRGEECTEVDTHVKNRKGTVDTFVPGRVELTYHR